MISGNKSIFSVDDLLSNAFAMYDGGRRGLPMYDVRCTMYDVRLRCSRALRGGCGANANGMSWSHDRTWLQSDGDARWQTGSAYVRCTTYNTHDDPVEGARAAGGKCVWTARMRCPAGASRQWGAYESTYDLDYSAPKARAMRNFSGGEGWSMTGGWFERYRIMQSYVHGLVKS